MKYLKSYRIFESIDISIEEDINLTLLNLSDSSSKLFDTAFHGDFLIYDLNLNEDDYDKGEAESANLRLGDLGYKLLRISRTYDNSTWLASIIKIDLYDKLKDNDILFWNDLKWEKWEINKILGGNARHCRLKLDEHNRETTDEYDISIIDGEKNRNLGSEIEFNVTFGEQDDFRFENICTAELELIKLQIEYFNIRLN